MSHSHAAAADVSPSTASLHGLDGVNFFLAGVLAGFGPYVAVYLADQRWTQDRIAFVLSASAFAGLLSQVPGGELLDSTRSKRVIVALGVLVVALSAMIIEFRPTFPLVLIGLTLQGITGGVLWPAIAAISLGLVGHSALPEQLGRNQRFAATGSLAAAGLMGLIATPLKDAVDAKRPNRERESLVGEQTRIVNRMKATLIRLGIRGFNPKLKKAAGRLEDLRTPEDEPIPPNTMAELRRDMDRHTR